MFQSLQQCLRHHAFAVVADDDCIGRLNALLRRSQQTARCGGIRVAPTFPINPHDLLLVGHYPRLDAGWLTMVGKQAGAIYFFFAQ